MVMGCQWWRHVIVGLNVKEVLMALGAWSADVDFSLSVKEALFKDDGNPRKLWALVYDSNDLLVYPPLPLLWGKPGKEKIEIGGTSILWDLGIQGIGPTIDDREYLSNANKLDNPVFALDPPDIYWRRAAEGSGWSITTGLATLVASLDGDDIWEVDRKYPAAPGQTWMAGATIIGGGRWRVRLLFEGQFNPPDIAIPYSSWTASVRGDIVLGTDPEGVVGGPAYRVHTGYVNRAANGAFDDGVGLNGWAQGAGAWYPITGDGTAWSGDTYAMTNTDILVSGDKRLVNSQDGGVTFPVVAQVVAPGEVWENRFVIRPHAGSSADGEAFGRIRLLSGGVEVGIVETKHVSSTQDGWGIVIESITIPDGINGLIPEFVVRGHTTGQWDVDSVTIFRALGNVDQVVGPQITVTSSRTYDWRVPYRVDPGISGGRVQLRAVLTSDYRPTLVIEGPDLRGQQEDQPLQYATFSIEMPSGYTRINQLLYSEDVPGVTYVGQGTLIDKDHSTSVADTIADGPSGAVSVSTVAPDGTDTVRIQVVGEVFSFGYVLAAQLVRTTLDPATGNDIIADLLVHPSTGLPVGIAAGTINCPEVIPFDWRQVKMTLLAAFAHYCDVISEPTREYRINPALPPTIDVSTSPFVQRPIVLLPTDIDVEDVADPTVDVTNRATEIEVIGAEVTRLNGQTTLITATAQVPGDTEYDLNNNPIVRTRPVSDGTIDTHGYAQAYADDQAVREAFPGLIVDVTLTGTPYQRGELDVGDWLEIFEPESGIEDQTNPKTVEGVPCFPRVMRAVARDREHGPSFYVLMLRPDGSTFPLNVNHSERDATKLTLADRRLYDWEADPGGGATGNQYMRDRASKPR